MQNCQTRFGFRVRDEAKTKEIGLHRPRNTRWIKHTYICHIKAGMEDKIDALVRVIFLSLISYLQEYSFSINKKCWPKTMEMIVHR